MKATVPNTIGILTAIPITPSNFRISVRCAEVKHAAETSSK